LSFGGTECTVIDVKIAVRLAIMKMASAVILAHNHPSGNPAPSSSDIEQTRQLKNALAFFDIQLLDHIIVSDDSYYSFSDEVTHKVS
jgi:DNA repair protein RadC